MSDWQSSYYPPRAGWNRRVNRWGYTWRRRLHLEELNVHLGTTPSRFVLGLLVPGFAFCDAGWKTVGRAMMMGWCVAAAVFVIWLGYIAANVAFGLMMSMHVSSILYLFNRTSPRTPIVQRLIFSLGVLFVVGQLVYACGIKWFQSHLFMPLRVGEKVYVINRMAEVGTLRRGDFVACRAEGSGYGGVQIRDGYILDRVLAVPYDEVQFSATEFSVNGSAGPKLRLMPSAGTFVMPEKTWLVWPTLDIVTNMNIDRETIAHAVLRMAMVERGEVIGKPFGWWFWRKQTQ